MTYISLCFILLRKYPHWWTPTKKKNKFTNLQWSQKQWISPFFITWNQRKTKTEIKTKQTSKQQRTPGGIEEHLLRIISSGLPASWHLHKPLQKLPKTGPSSQRFSTRWVKAWVCVFRRCWLLAHSHHPPILLPFEEHHARDSCSSTTPPSRLTAAPGPPATIKGLQHLLHAILFVQVAWDMARIYYCVRPYPPPPTASR